MQRVAWIAGLVLVLALDNGGLNAYAQSLPTLKTSASSGSDVHFQIWRNGEVVAKPEISGEEPVRVIVEFDQPPLLAAASQGVSVASKSSHLESIQVIHSQFEEDLSRLFALSEDNDASKNAEFAERLHFVTAFNGVALSIPHRMIRQIRAFGYVKRVRRDGEVLATGFRLRDELLKAQTSGATLGGTGEGVRIAIIDTGIDYRHPALGGGFGASFKVTQGFDFVNDDADPSDDNGHGTHVAGIAAGSGAEWQGVAPEAELLAYKVLDQDGAGRDTWVLAAIERALDPDQNPLTDDAVDIINLSLGSGAGGDSQHPVTLAVEHAVRSGVVCVVAAGNSGHLGKASIAAPGNALSAITVGAATRDGQIAPFSAQGPTGSIKTTSLPRLGMKPDVFAPGVGVHSTWLNGAFKQMDGTSMATPHIAGIAARILQQNEDWSPAQVKSALVQFADEDGMMPWLQEEGRVSALPAKELPALVTPSRFDFGLVDSGSAYWSQPDTLTLYNFDEVSKTYDLTSSGDYPGNVELTFSGSSITVAPGESQSVPFSITGAFDSLPKKAFPDAYEGAIQISSSSENILIPFSFFNPSRARLELKESADVLFLFGHEQGHEFSFFNTEGALYLFLPDDRYDAIAQYDGGSHIVIKEDVFEGGVVQAVVSKLDAVHTLSLSPVDVNQQALAHISGMHALTHKASGYSIVRQGGFLSMAAQLPAIQYFSSFSDAYKVEIKATGFSTAGHYYELPFSVDEGMSDDIQLLNTSDSLVQINYHYAVPERYTKLFFVPWSYTSMSETRRSTIGAKLDVNEGSPFVLYPPFEQTVFLMPPATSDYSWQGHFHTLHTEDFSLFKLATNVSQVTILETDEIHVGQDGGVKIGYEGALSYAASEPLDLYPGAGIMRWAGKLDNSSTKIKMKEAPEGGYFINEWGDLSPRSFSMKLYAADADESTESLLSDSLFNVPNLPVARWLGESQVLVEPGAYKLVIEDVFSSMQGWGTRAKATLEFQTDLADSNPPRITQLFIDSNGEPKRILHPARTHTIMLGVEEVCNWCTEDTEIADLRVEIRASQDSVWRNLDIEEQERWFRAPLPEGLSEAFYAMRVTAEDESRNRLTYVLEPAFELGVSRVPLLQDPVMGQESVILSPTLSWQATQDAQAYHVQLATDALFEHVIHEQEHEGETRLTSSMLMEGQRYYWRVRAKTMAGYMPWSQPFWFDTLSRVGADSGQVVPDVFELNHVFPNPVRNEAFLQYSTPKVALVKIELYDLLGRRIKVLESMMRPAGKYIHSFDTSNLASGTYIMRLQAGSFVATRQFIRL